MLSADREQLRRQFLTAWRKRRAGEPLEPMESLIAAVVFEHPEYHRLLEETDAALMADYLPELGATNPFLHMGLHIALREQVATDRPPGIADIHRGLMDRLGDRHQAEHAMIDCLGEALWQAQRGGTAPDEQGYLECLKRLRQSHFKDHP
jgi:hypothetical protein